MIIGIGVDVVGIDRFEARLAATPALRQRLFTRAEQDLPVRSLAARFAAKEALAKALGAPPGLSWQDVTIPARGGEPPTVQVTGAVAARMSALGGDRVWLSLSHDGGVAVASVVVEAAVVHRIADQGHQPS